MIVKKETNIDKKCPKSKINQLSAKKDLKACARCKCVFYCGKECQVQDWKARHKKFCKTLEVAEAAAVADAENNEEGPD